MSYQYICATCGKKEQSCECHKNYPRPSREQDEIERLRDAIKRQAAAAKIGMDAATRISSVQLEQARIARAESSPDAIDSERNANAVLTGEVERLRAELAAAKRDAERYLSGILTWASECASCDGTGVCIDDGKDCDNCRDIRELLPEPDRRP